MVGPIPPDAPVHATPAQRQEAAARHSADRHADVHSTYQQRAGDSSSFAPRASGQVANLQPSFPQTSPAKDRANVGAGADASRTDGLWPDLPAHPGITGAPSLAEAATSVSRAEARSRFLRDEQERWS